jgi:hypothetical protein
MTLLCFLLILCLNLMLYKHELNAIVCLYGLLLRSKYSFFDQAESSLKQQ